MVGGGNTLPTYQSDPAFLHRVRQWNSDDTRSVVGRESWKM